MGNYSGAQMVPLQVQKRSYDQLEVGLFDFHSINTRSKFQKFSIEKGGYLENEYGNLSYNEGTEPTQDSILHIDLTSPARISLHCLTPKIGTQKVWMVVGALPIEISVQDQVKLGRYQFKVVKIQLQHEDLTKSFTFRPSFLQANVLIQNSRIPQCRLCFLPGSQGNELVSPCLCSGSQQFIHLKCLRDWLNTKISITQRQQYQMIVSPPLRCEVCGAFLKKQFEFDDKKLPLLKYNIPKGPYLILEGSKVNDINSITLVIKLTQNRQMSIGRETTNDIQLNDISVSRDHFQLFVMRSRVYIADRQSKFGTLLRSFEATLFRERIELLFNNSLLKLTRTSSCCLGQITQFEFKC